MNNLNNTHTNEVKQVTLKGLKDFNELVDLSKSSAKGIFAMNRHVLSLFILDNKDYLKVTKAVTSDGKINPIIKELKDKSFKPYQLLYGTFSLDKVLKASQSKDFLSYMQNYKSSVITFIESSDEVREYILERGEKINKLFQDFNAESLNSVDFCKSLLTYFPSFKVGLENKKVAPNVAKFIFENDVLSYDLLNIKSILDIELETKRKQIKTELGNKGLIEFDNLINLNFSVESAERKLLTVTKVANSEALTA